MLQFHTNLLVTIGTKTALGCQGLCPDGKPLAKNYGLAKTIQLKSIRFVIQSILAYAALSAAFSVLGLFATSGQFLPKPYLIGNPLEVSGISTQHIVGHVVFGLMAGVASARIRYVVIAGMLPISLDADHLIQFLNLDAIPRMSHSILFGVISIPTMMLLMGKKDYLLGAVCFSAVLAHVSFDILLGGTTEFPLYIPIIGKMVTFQGYDWIPFLLAAIAIVGATRILTKNRAAENKPEKHKSSS